MSADTAVGLFAIGAVFLVALVALAWRHFREEDVEIDREVDGRYIAEVRSIPGAIAYGDTEEEARENARRIADPWSGVDPRHGDDGNSGHG